MTLGLTGTDGRKTIWSKEPCSKEPFSPLLGSASPNTSISRFRVFAVLVAVVTTGLFTSPALAAAAAKTKTVAFSGHYSGTVSLLINNSEVMISSVTGTGTGTPSLVGASSVAGTGSASATAQCDPFSGTGSITGAASKITLIATKSSSTGCSSGESGPVTVTFSGVAKITGASGTAKGATGSLHFKGSFKLSNTSGSQSGPFSVTLSGKLKVKR